MYPLLQANIRVFALNIVTDIIHIFQDWQKLVRSRSKYVSSIAIEPIFLEEEHDECEFI